MFSNCHVEDVSGFVPSTGRWNAATGEQLMPRLKHRTSVNTRGPNHSRWEFGPHASSRVGGLLELSTVWDGDLLRSPPRPGTQSLYFLDHVHSFFHAAKDNVPTIQPEWAERRLIPPQTVASLIKAFFWTFNAKTWQEFSSSNRD